MNRGFAALDGTPKRAARRAAVWPPAPKSKPDAHAVRGWSIQVGAFNRFATAHLAVTRAARAVPDLLRTRVSIRSERGGAGKRYLARLVGLSQDKARRSCATLMQKNIRCFVLPGSTSGIAQGSR
jgi:cell division septation protein DedD